jgi:hypothetical protein
VNPLGGPGLNEAVRNKLVHQNVNTDGSGGWDLSVIMTCVPAFPNNLGRLYEVVVQLGDVASLLGLVDTIGPCNAPDQELRSRLAEARVAWQDDDPVAKAILTAFGAQFTSGAQVVGVSGTISQLPDPQAPSYTLKPINLTQELVPLALALAQSDLVSKLDHYEGTKAIPVDGTIVPIGSFMRITHRVTKNMALTIIQADRQRQPIDPIEFLPSSARKYLLQEIQTQR